MINRIKVSSAVLAVVFAILTTSSAFAGAFGGARSGSYRLSAGNIDSFQIAFRGGESAVVAVVGDGYSNLDLYVYDSYGNLVSWDEGVSDRCSARWFSRYDETFTIKVVNRGAVYNLYGIATN